MTSTDYLTRYSRQLIVCGWSQVLQEQLGNARAVLDPELEITALYLAGAGIGALSFTAPHRALAQRIRALNPAVAIDEQDAPADALIRLGRRPLELRAAIEIMLCEQRSGRVEVREPGGAERTFILPLASAGARDLAAQALAAQLVIRSIRSRVAEGSG